MAISVQTVPADYILYYEGSQPITVGDYYGYFGDAGKVRPGMPMMEFYDLMDDAVYHFQKEAFDLGLRDVAPYDREQWQRDADALADFDDSRDLAMVGFSNPFVSGGARRYGGSRRAAPAAYRAPDRAALEEQIKMYVVATTGTSNADLVRKATDAFLAADKQEYDRTVAGGTADQVDPLQAAKEVVRGSDSYRSVHQLRPESVDELDWVTTRQGKLRSMGISSMRAEGLGIQAATVDASDEALQDMGEGAQFVDTGRLLQSQRQGLVNSARAVLSLV